MTLIMSLFGKDYVALVADRRLTCNGRLVDDESNKATALKFEDATLACGFTGLATCGAFRTQDWLLDALWEAAPPDYLSVPTLQRLRDRISHEFATNPEIRRVPLDHRRLAIHFAGFHYAPEGVFPCGAVLTNFAGFAGIGDLPTGPSDFVLRQVVPDDTTRVGVIGAWPAVNGDDYQALNSLLASNKTAAAAIGKAIETFHTIADRPAAAGTVGGQLNSVVLHANRSAQVEANYHVQKSSAVTYMADMAVLTRAEQLMMKGGISIKARTQV